MAAAIFRIITELSVFVVQGWRSDMAAGLEWSEPTGIMMAWRRSLVTITATGVATLNFGETARCPSRAAIESARGRRSASGVLWFLTPEVANAAYAEQADDVDTGAAQERKGLLQSVLRRHGQPRTSDRALRPPPAPVDDTLAVMRNTSPIWLLVASLLSGLVAVVVTLLVSAWQDQREIKRDVLRRFAGTRWLLTEPGRVLPNGEPFVVLNEAFVVFADDPEVLSALDNLRTGGDHRDSELVVALIKRMASAADVPVTLDDAFIRGRMTPQRNR